MATHDTMVNASGTYNNSASNHDEARFCCRYSCGYNSYCCPAAKEVVSFFVEFGVAVPHLRPA
jgi:hypothetical protein